MKFKVSDAKALEMQVRSWLTNLGQNAAEVAIALYDEKVRKAKCGDPEKCALAQGIVNKLPKGWTTDVCGDEIVIRNPKKVEVVSVEPPDSAVDFISNFDSKRYRFLM